MGFAVGSFLNCFIYRMEQGESLKGRSYCPNCKHTLNWLDLFPVFSFLFLSGRCRYCKKEISWQYPVVEFFTAYLFFLVFKFQLPLSQLVYFGIKDVILLALVLYVTSSLIAIFVYDLKHFIIPDKILFPAVGAGLLYQLIFDYNFLISNAIFAAFSASLFFFLMFILSRGTWIGFGDVKLAILLGLILGFPNILAGLFLAFLFGAIIGVFLLVLKNKGLKSEVPFAPFLIAGTFLAMFFGQQIVNWYLSFLYI